MEKVKCELELEKSKFIEVVEHGREELNDKARSDQNMKCSVTLKTRSVSLRHFYNTSMMR